MTHTYLCWSCVASRMEGLVLGAFVIVLIVSGYLTLWKWLRALCGHDTSGYLTRTGRESGTSPLLMRSTFNRVPMIHKRPSKLHTHPLSAAGRTTGSNFIDRVAEDIGRKAYFYQCSAADRRRGRDGSRKYYWIKDLTVRSSPVDLREEHVLALVDVDYYVNMPQVLLDTFRPTLLYTFQPESVARSLNEYSYTFDARNRLHYRHAGGGAYKHKVWNYGTDNVIVAVPGSIIPFRLPQVASFLVDKRKVGPDHEVVCLTPLRKWVGLAAIVARRNLSGNKLKRLEVVQGEFTRMLIQRRQGLFVSTGTVGGYAECTVPISYDEALRTVGRTNATKLTLPTVMGYVLGGDLADRKAQASVLLLYHRCEGPRQEAPTAYPVEDAVRDYHFGLDDYDPSSKSSLVAFMSPFVHGAFSPVQSLGNERVCVENRVTKFTAKAKTFVVTEFLDGVMREFAAHLVKHPHTLHPVDIDEIYRRQSRPSQRHILDRSMAEDADRVVKMFVKKEAYPDVKDPRPISQINGTDKRDYSAFMYALGELVKTHSWYAFGTTPHVIANRVVELLEHAVTCVNTDFSRFDGRVSPILRELERIVLMRAFDPLYSEQLNELHLGQYNLPAVGRLGTKYFTGTARASGSPETALFNSLSNAFVAYLAFRSTRSGGVFIGPDQAWHMLGIYGGDDGLTADINPVIYSDCAKSVGMKLDAEEIRRGDMGVKFLARVYGPDVWHGDHNSCCDLVRQLSKFHTTVSLPPYISPIDKLLEKARAFALTDSNTPILGAFVNRVVNIAGFRTISDLKPVLNIWNSDLPFEVQYPNRDSGWMVDYALNTVGKLGFDFSLFEEWLVTVKDLDACLTPPLCAPPKVASTTQEVVVDGDLLQPPAVVPIAKKERRRVRATPVRRGRARAPSTQRTVRFVPSGTTG